MANKSITQLFEFILSRGGGGVVKDELADMQAQNKNKLAF